MCMGREQPCPKQEWGMLYEKQLQPFLEDFGSEPLCHIPRTDHIKKPIFTKIVVVTGSRCLLLCNRVCFNGSDFQMCSVGSGCLPGPLWPRGSSQLPPWQMGLLLLHEHCSSSSFLVQLHSPWVLILGSTSHFGMKARKVTEYWFALHGKGRHSLARLG